jgi:GNAT superfamily N-acetyltransferase
LKSCGHEACAWAAGKEVPWLFVLTHEELETGVDAGSILDGCGLSSVMPLTGMLAQQVTSVATNPGGLQLTVPEDDAGCSGVIDQLGGLRGGPRCGQVRNWHPRLLERSRSRVGVAGGTPASSAAVLMVDGYRYVALVATHPAHQRRGYAEAAMRRALEVAATAHGEQPTVLHATEAGRPLYQRMGYAPISTHTVFMEKRFLEGH